MELNPHYPTHSLVTILMELLQFSSSIKNIFSMNLYNLKPYWTKEALSNLLHFLQVHAKIILKTYRSSETNVGRREWSPFKAVCNSGIRGASYCGTWHCNIPVCVSTVTRSCSARRHGWSTGTDRIAGDPCKWPAKGSLQW